MYYIIVYIYRIGILNAPLENALQYLVNSQEANGSWSGPYCSRIRETLLVNFASRVVDTNTLRETSRSWLAQNRKQLGFTDVERKLNAAMLKVADSGAVDLNNPHFYTPEILRKTLLIYCLGIIKGLKVAVPDQYTDARVIFGFLRDHLHRNKHLIKGWARAELYSAYIIIGTSLGVDMRPTCRTLLKLRGKDKSSWFGSVATTAFALIALDFAGHIFKTASKEAYGQFFLDFQQPDGGWSYYPLPYWDTGLAVLVINRVENISGGLAPELHAARVKALKFLERGQNSDGGWPFFPGLESEADTTSVILMALAPGSTSAKKCLAYYRRLQFRSGEFKGLWPVWRKSEQPSSEVVAHIAKALQLQNRGDLSLLAQEWLAGRIARNDWQADWGRNAPYGIAALVWALAEKSLDALKPLEVYLLENQNRDGGWGALSGQSSNASATANAVIALQELRKAGSGSQTLVRGISRGKDYLEKTQLANGTWPRVTEVLGPRPFHYSDDCSTHTFVLLSLLN